MTLEPARLLDPEVAAAVGGVPPQTTWDPQTMRAAGAAILGHETPAPEGVRRTVRTAPSGGADLELRLHTPAAGANAVILSIHGGGFVAGQAAYDDDWNALLALRTGAVVVSPNYRLPPEHPYPAPLEDCVAAWRWILARHPDAVRIVYGDSAGGTWPRGSPFTAATAPRRCPTGCSSSSRSSTTAWTRPPCATPPTRPYGT